MPPTHGGQKAFAVPASEAAFDARWMLFQKKILIWCGSNCQRGLCLLLVAKMPRIKVEVAGFMPSPPTGAAQPSCASAARQSRTAVKSPSSSLLHVKERQGLSNGEITEHFFPDATTCNNRTRRCAVAAAMQKTWQPSIGTLHPFCTCNKLATKPGDVTNRNWNSRAKAAASLRMRASSSASLIGCDAGACNHTISVQSPITAALQPDELFCHLPW